MISKGKLFDYEADLEAAVQMRWLAVGELLARSGRAAVPPKLVSTRGLGTFGGALALATATFWAVMLSSPPTTEAAVEPPSAARELPAPACIDAPPCP